MSYTLQLGSSFPYADGTLIADFSKYIGNNTFIRLLSQTDNNKTMIGMYTVDSIYTNTPVITTVHEQILFETTDLHNPRLVQLGDGGIMVVGNNGHASGVLNYAVVHYDGLGEFVVDVPLRTFWEDGATSSDDIYQDFEYIIDGNIPYLGSAKASYNIFPYNNTSVLYITENNYSGVGRLSVGIIEDVYGTSNVTSGAMRFFRDATLGKYYDPMYTNIKKYDGLIYISASNYRTNSTSIVDVTNKTTVSQRSSYKTDMVKLDTDRYISLTHAAGNELQFSLSNSLPTLSDANIRFEPFVPLYGSYTTKEILRWTIPLDRFHAIHFRNSSNDTISAYVLKIVDENYGFVSDATVNGVAVLTDNLFNSTQGESSQRTRLVSTTDGEWLKQLSATQFMIQTGFNTFHTFEITATP